MNKSPLHVPEKYPMIGAAALVVLTVVFVGFSRLAEISARETISTDIVATKKLLFKDNAGGDVSVVDWETGVPVWTYREAEGGFARTALRAMAYTRRLQGAGPDSPMLLQKAANGRLVLHDPVTNKEIGLNAFGEANLDQFAVLFDTGAAQPGAAQQ